MLYTTQRGIRKERGTYVVHLSGKHNQQYTTKQILSLLIIFLLRWVNHLQDCIFLRSANNYIYHTDDQHRLFGID